jgi:Zn-finger nucleic acid-binding protein
LSIEIVKAMSRYRESETVVMLTLDDALRAELDTLCELSNGALDREEALLAAVRQGLPELLYRAQSQAARSVQRCPRCRQMGLAPRDESGVLFQACIECGGIWLDSASLARLLAEPASSFVAIARAVDDNARSTRDVTPSLACPICGTPLTRRRQQSAGIRLDTCDRHGTWFDRTELARFTNVVADLRRSRAELEALAADVGLAELGEWLADLRGRDRDR